jgi:hypothetical protein
MSKRLIIVQSIYTTSVGVLVTYCKLKVTDVCGLFNDVLSISGYVASSGWMIE